MPSLMNASIVPTATVAFALALIGSTARPAYAQLKTKPQVANLIKNVENGVDEFRNYLEKRGENASNAASAAAASGRRSRQATTDQKTKATAKKDALDWVAHYNLGRPHASLGPGIPDGASVDGLVGESQGHSLPVGCRVVATPILGGLHHEYCLERHAA